MASEPELTHRRCGGWLASTPTDQPIRFGVEGSTREEAVAAYRRTEVLLTALAERGDRRTPR